VLRILGNDITPATIVLVALLLISGSQFTLFAMWFDMEIYISEERRFNRMVAPKTWFIYAMILANDGNINAVSNARRRHDARPLFNAR
jgi:hypothetical protein